MSLWHCREHGLTGPNPCCSGASLAQVNTPVSEPRLPSSNERMARELRIMAAGIEGVADEGSEHPEAKLLRAAAKALSGDSSAPKESRAFTMEEAFGKPFASETKPDAWMSSINPKEVIPHEEVAKCWHNPPIPLYRKGDV